MPRVEGLVIEDRWNSAGGWKVFLGDGDISKERSNLRPSFCATRSQSWESVTLNDNLAWLALYFTQIPTSDGYAH